MNFHGTAISLASARLQNTASLWTLSTAHVQRSYASLHHCIHFAHEFSDPRFFGYFVDL